MKLTYLTQRVPVDRATGDFSFTPNKDLSDGNYEMKMVEIDQAGNRSREIPMNGFRVDTTAPNLSLTEVNDNVAANSTTLKPETIQAISKVGNLLGSKEGDGSIITNDNTPTLRGKVEAGSNLVVTIIKTFGLYVMNSLQGNPSSALCKQQQFS